MNESITLQKALFTIKKLKQRLQEQQTQSEPIAIVGLSCRFPETNGKDAYWRMLCEGKNVISKLSEDRWELLKNTAEISLRDPEHPYWGGYLSNIDAFDAYFFGISPREALRMDPQHRLLLEVAYEAMEDAGLSVETLAGSNTAVFSSLDVSQLAYMQTMDTEMDALYLPTGNAISIAANRISYLFDLRGPSLIIDSACSSSMAGLHLACLNLQNKLCDMALVCGAKLNLLPYVNYVMTKAKMLSPDGQCHTFDTAANGYVQGEGVGVIVLKPLSKALQDKDRIYAIIEGSAVNQDGKTNGLTAPNGLQQEVLLRSALKIANVSAEDISYIECHGTGTFLGDPIEIQALGTVLGNKRENPCLIGSVKTNIGHLEAAAGVASVIKLALALYHAKIPPHLNFKNPNPHIAFEKYHLAIPTQLEDWKENKDKGRIAGVSGFGFGGTNAHVIMRGLKKEETFAVTPVIPQAELFTVSAKDSDALIHLLEKWRDFLKENQSINLSQLCYNTHLRRSHYPFRIAIIANTIGELTNLLEMVQQDPIQNNLSIFINASQDKKLTHKTKILDFTSIKLTELANAYVNRQAIDWKKYEENRTYPHMDMPTYAWQHKKYWPILGNRDTSNVTVTHPLQGKQLKSPLKNLQFLFNMEIKFIPDVQDTYNILHVGYYLEMFAFAAEQLSSLPIFTLENHIFLSPLVVPNNTSVMVQLILEKIDDHFAYTIYSNTYEQKTWVEHATGVLKLEAESVKSIEKINTIQSRCNSNGTAEELYTKILSMGIPAGESIRWTKQYWRNKDEILCEFSQPKFSDKNDNYKLQIHPSVFDASIQPLFGLLPNNNLKPYIASSISSLKFHGKKEGPYFLLGHLKNSSDARDKIMADIFLLNRDSQLIAEFNDIGLTQFENKIEINNEENYKKIDLSVLPTSEQKQVVTRFLVEQIGLIFSMPKEDIHCNLSLRDMGIDSLMALVLMRTLELGLGITYSMQALLEGPTINEIVEFVIQHVHPSPIDEPMTKDNLWIAYRKKIEKPLCRLFCFPYGGAGASIYREWQSQLPHIEICPIQLPGREDRLNERPLKDMKLLIKKLSENLSSELDVPFGFFGHSFGSLIAFELTRHLREKQLPTPGHLFVSAFPDPRTPTKSLDAMLKQLSTINVQLSDLDNPQISESQLIQLISILEENGMTGFGEQLLNPEIFKVMLPIFAGDMSLVKSYLYQDEDPLNIPITVFLGQNDTWVSFEDHLSWVDHSLKRCVFHEFDGGHLFIKNEEIRNRILKIIAKSFSMTREKEITV